MQDFSAKKRRTEYGYWRSDDWATLTDGKCVVALLKYS